MIYIIDLLNESDLIHINEMMQISDYERGLTSSNLLDELKNNLECTGYECHNLTQYMLEILNNSVDFREITTAKEYAGILFSKYESGMYYNSHNDNYMMGNGSRTDYSCTIFLNNPEEYAGGELVITMGNQDFSYKLKAGQCLIYPTGCKHKVNVVESGSRKVCVLWVESCVSDAEIRNILSDYHIMWSKYAINILENVGKEAYNDILNMKFRLMRKYGTFKGIKYGK